MAGDLDFTAEPDDGRDRAAGRWQRPADPARCICTTAPSLHCGGAFVFRREVPYARSAQTSVTVPVPEKVRSSLPFRVRA
jgi:hypothetical protein